jgi:circadian clock protein KaiB
MPRKKPPTEDLATIEGQFDQARAERYTLKLYVAGHTSRSTRAIERIKQLCEEHLHGRYDLDVIDLYQRPALARGEQIVAAPTLVKSLPLPLRRIIGDMTDEKTVLVGLDLRKRS